jgi:hypothetical protein
MFEGQIRSHGREFTICVRTFSLFTNKLKGGQILNGKVGK